MRDTSFISITSAPLPGALFALKQKKMYDKQVQNLDNQLLTLEQQKVALENANISATVVNTMAAGTTAMRNIQATMYSGVLALDGPFIVVVVEILRGQFRPLVRVDSVCVCVCVCACMPHFEGMWIR